MCYADELQFNVVWDAWIIIYFMIIIIWELVLIW